MHTFEIVLVVAWLLSLAMTILNVVLIPRLEAGGADKGDAGMADVPVRHVAASSRDSSVARSARVAGEDVRHPDARHPSVSIIIPARNEERAIANTVRAMLAQTYRDLEVIVVD